MKTCVIIVAMIVTFNSCSQTNGRYNLNFIAKSRLDGRPISDEMVCLLRGGEKASTDTDDEEGKRKDDSDRENLTEFDGDEDDDDGGGSSVEIANPLSFLSKMWEKTPPITQIYVGSSLFITLISFVINQNKWPLFLNLDWGSVLMKFQYWRLFTSFLFFGPFGLNYVLTIHFVWTYMSQLEKLNYKKPESFFVLMCFGAVTLLGSYTLLGISSKFLGHNLSTYLVYIWARTFEGTDVNVMDLFVLRAELLPWFFCLQTYILEGEFPFADLLGIAVGHLYYYLTQQKILVAPSFVQSWFQSKNVMQRYERFKDDFE